MSVLVLVWVDVLVFMVIPTTVQKKHVSCVPNSMFGVVIENILYIYDILLRITLFCFGGLFCHLSTAVLLKSQERIQIAWLCSYSPFPISLWLPPVNKNKLNCSADGLNGWRDGWMHTKLNFPLGTNLVTRWTWPAYVAPPTPLPTCPGSSLGARPPLAGCCPPKWR